MTNDEVLSMLQGIDGFYGTKTTHAKYGDNNLIKHWTDRLSKLPIGNCQRVVTSLQEASLAHKKPSAPSLGMFLAKYKSIYGNEDNDSQTMLKSDCGSCRNGRVTVVYAGDHTSCMAIISSKDGLCKVKKPKDPSGFYTYYRTERQPCSKCDKGHAANAEFKYDRDKIVAINEHAFLDDNGAAVWFSGVEFMIPCFLKYLNKDVPQVKEPAR